MPQNPLVPPHRTLVFWAERQALQAGTLEDSKGRALYSIKSLDDGSLLSLPKGRVLWHFPLPNDGTPPSLYWAKLQEDAQNIDLAPLWAVLHQRQSVKEGKSQKLSPEERVLIGQKLAFSPFVLAVFHDKCFFRLKNGDIFRFSQEESRRRLAEKAEEDQKAQIVQLAIKAMKMKLQGEALPKALHQPYETSVDALLLHLAQEKAASKSEALAPILEAFGLSDEELFDFLVDLGEILPGGDLSPYRNELPIRFSDEALEQAANFKPSPKNARVRDLTKLLSFTIDDKHTLDMDDAIAMDEGRIYVFISDVASFVSPQSPLDLEAQRRGLTTYLPERRIPMLPLSLGEKALSLRAGEVRAVLAFSFDISDEGHLRHFDLERSEIKIHANLSYDDVSSVLEGQPSRLSKELQDLLQKIHDKVARYKAFRQRRGALHFHRLERMFHVQAAPDSPYKTAIQLHTGDPSSPARQLISELMVAASEGAGSFFAERQIPAIYRTQAAPKSPLSYLSERSISEPESLHQMLSQLPPSQLSTLPSRHYSLGIEAYSSVTSPIRRYMDLAMHQQLLFYLKIGQVYYSEKNLRGVIETLKKRQALVRLTERQAHRHWALGYLEREAHVKLIGHVLDFGDEGASVQVEPLGLRVKIQALGGLKPGDKAPLEVLSLSQNKDLLELRFKV